VDLVSLFLMLREAARLHVVSAYGEGALHLTSKRTPPPIPLVPNRDMVDWRSRTLHKALRAGRKPKQGHAPREQRVPKRARKEAVALVAVVDAIVENEEDEGGHRF
jgi:hypothetical protein